MAPGSTLHELDNVSLYVVPCGSLPNISYRQVRRIYMIYLEIIFLEMIYIWRRSICRRPICSGIYVDDLFVDDLSVDDLSVRRVKKSTCPLYTWIVVFGRRMLYIVDSVTSTPTINFTGDHSK